MTLDTSLLDQPRFRQPENWRWHSFMTSTGNRVRFGSVFPKDKIPDAVIVCLPGFREFGEKYFELAHNMLDRNLGFWVLDWAGQGGSERLLSDQFKVHSLGFDQQVADLRQFIFDYVKPAAVHPDVGRLPVIFIGHSMGAHIGLRYLHDNPQGFIRAAAFSAPMVRIAQFESYPGFVSRFATACMMMLSKSYVRGREAGMEELRKIAPGEGVYSSDPERDALHRLWFEKSPDLEVKGPTYKWLYEAVKSSSILEKKSFLKKIATPVMMGLAERDAIVSNKALRRAASAIPDAELLELSDAKHEILMEVNDIRDRFLASFDGFIQRHVLSREDRLKKF